MLCRYMYTIHKESVLLPSPGLRGFHHSQQDIRANLIAGKCAVLLSVAPVWKRWEEKPSDMVSIGRDD